ncbi:unnamed protein product [Phytophthora fragariaefolia]|uniref:Unnamed protein product n=1 Tax=Phytophthora fragariaefolia TaxID=1490495 RepID=A0A9W6U380_9STRA|nr:unnamed protein product [Phytophthora fragariaefolia]
MMDYARTVAPLQEKLEQMMRERGRRKSQLSGDTLNWTDDDVEVEFRSTLAMVERSCKLIFPDRGPTVCMFSDASLSGYAMVVTQVRRWQNSVPVEEQSHELLICRGGMFKGATELVYRGEGRATLQAKMNPNDEMKPPARRNLDAELLAASDKSSVKLETGSTEPNPELARLQAEVIELRRQAAATTNMVTEIEKMRAGFAQMMTAQPMLQAELAKLRSNATATTKLYAEIANLKTELQTAMARPSPAPPAPPETSTTVRTTPRIKDVLCRKFSGQEVYPGVGSGFEDFILEYEQAIATESLLNQSRWTLQIKASVLVNFLEGKAARFFHSNVAQWRTETSNFNYDDFKSKLKSEFGCRLNQVQLCKRLTSSKRPQDSWSEYLDYLKYISLTLSSPDTSGSAPTDELGAVICMDLKTDLKPDRNGHRHVLTIVDHASNYNQVFLLHTKDEAFDKFLVFANDFQRQYDLNIKVVRTDGGGEFLNSQFEDYAACNGIHLQNTHPDTSASNGKAERFHRTLMNSARAMLWASTLPQRYWGDAVLYASYIRNIVPTRANADYKSPIDVLTGKQPRVSHILKFGSKCTVFIPRKTGRSLQKRAEKAIILGVSTKQKGYRLLLPRTKKFVISPDVQNVDKLDVQDPSTAKVLQHLHGENSSPNTACTGASGLAAVQPSTQSDLSQSSIQTDDDDVGVPEDFGRPIPAGVLR